ncbi:MAG: hypothetical protein V1644_03070, partial [Candidatus Micrarchaeota archaeon]
MNSSGDGFLSILDLQSQLKGWLEENKDRFEQRKPLQSLVINKIMYYSTRNDDLYAAVTSGWFRYGPCVEVFR